MLKKITAAILIFIGVLMVLEIVMEQLDENREWLKHTYRLKVDTIKTRFRIAKKYKDLNINTYYDLVRRPEDIEIRDNLISRKLDNPSRIILVDSTNALNQIHIYKDATYQPISEENRKNFIEAILTAGQDLPYGVKQEIVESYIGSKDNFRFIKVRTRITMTYSEKVSFNSTYIVSAYGYSFTVFAMTANDEDTDVIIRNMVITQQVRKKIS